MYRIGSTAADRFTDGFPNVLVARISNYNSGMTTLRLIPEMEFTCNGTIAGFTVAGRLRRGRNQPNRNDPIIQIWRQNSSQLSIYYITNSQELAIDKGMCAESSIVFPQGSTDSRDQVWKCNLRDTNRVPVQAGDVLGLLLPPQQNTSFRLSIARVSKGPTNHVFESQELTYQTVNLSNAMFENNLPQIAVNVESGTMYALLYLLAMYTAAFYH